MVVGSPQLIVPTSQATAGVQLAPGTHTSHVPAMQTLFVVELQTVPSGEVAVAVHTGPPLVHTIEADASHGLLVVQVAPGVHAVQVPVVLQTPVVLPDVQLVPAAR